MNTRILLFVAFATALFACGGSKKFQATTNEDKALFDAINTLAKKPSSAKAQSEIGPLYKQSVARHEEAADVYKNGSDETKWDKALAELNALQHIYNSLQATPATIGLVKPKNYLRDIEDMKQLAAEDFYNRAFNALNENSRESNMTAWEYFKKSNEYVPGYKDVTKQIKDAYERSVINVVINPIEDDNVFFPTGNWDGATSTTYRPQDYQEQLIRELGGRSATYTPARFYNDRDAKKDRITINREVSMRWRNITPLNATPRQYTRQASRSVENGKDTAGKTIFTTVYATMNVTEYNYTVQGDLEYRIADGVNRTTVDNSILHDEVNWTESMATYSGDSRALSQQDWNMINNRNGNRQPTKSDVMIMLMKKVMPTLKGRIQEAIK